MERDETSRIDAPQPKPSAAGMRFAAALAERLDAVVPHPFRVRAEEGLVSLYAGEARDSSSDVAGLLDQKVDAVAPLGERHSLASLAAMVAGNVLSSVQDGIAEATTEPWPRLPHGGMAQCGARTDGEQVYLWYGPEYDRETDPVVSFPPIHLDVVLGPR